MRQSTTTAVRSYRVYFRDGSNTFARAHDVDLPTDEEARKLAALMLEREQGRYPCAEVWDRARLVCTVNRAGASDPANTEEPSGVHNDGESLVVWRG